MREHSSLTDRPTERRVLSRIGTRRIVVGGVAVLFAASFAFAPVRGLAAEMLKVFRVQKVQTISLDPADLERIGEALSDGKAHVSLEDMGEAWIEGDPQPREVSLREAQAAVDFTILLPKDYIGVKPRLELTPKTSYRFKLNVDKVNESLAALGATHLLPKDLDGKVFSVEMSPMLLAHYEGDVPDEDSGEARWVVIGQGRSPELVMPEGVNALEIREVLINLPFLPEDVRQRLAGITDWEHTLLIPNIDGSAREVSVGGEQGVVMTEPSSDVPQGEFQPAAVVWQRDGVVFGVSGDLDEAKALHVAESMMR